MLPAGHASSILVQGPSAPSGRIGCVRVPGSKSATQRALVAAALAHGESVLEGALDAEDPRVLADCLGRIGAEIVARDGGLHVRGLGGLPHAKAPVELQLGENGTALRMLAAITGLSAGTCTLAGRGRLPERPLGDLQSALRSAGAELRFHDRPGCVPCVIIGAGWRGVPAEFQVSVHDTSQGGSGLLLALAGAPWPAKVRLVGGARRGYLQLTLDTLGTFGANAAASEAGADLVVELSGQGLRAVRVRLPGDPSAAALLLAAAAVARSQVRIQGLYPGDPHPDLRMIEELRRLGVRVAWEGSDLLADGAGRAGGGGRLEGLGRCPDAVPALVAVLAHCPGEWHLTDLAVLRLKESDRLAALADNLTRCGVEAWLQGPDLVLRGGVHRQETVPAVDPRGDHRIAMAFAVLALGVAGGVQVGDPGCVAKSWPGFFAAMADAVPGASAPYRK